MTKLICMLLFLVPLYAKAEGELELKEVFYSFDWSEASCRMQVHRKKERDKKLREYYYARGLEGLSDRLLTSSLFLSMFTDFDLLSSPKVTVTNLWRVDDEFINIYQNSPEHLFIELSGEGLWWRERKTRFPDEILFFLDQDKKELITTHKIFHSDYCLLNSDTKFEWSTVSDVSNPTVEELLDFLLKD